MVVPPTTEHIFRVFLPQRPWGSARRPEGATSKRRLGTFWHSHALRAVLPWLPRSPCSGGRWRPMSQSRTLKCCPASQPSPNPHYTSEDSTW